ncbi:unnamed protein product [marine sediment metagenome]|uniref:Uncharacterized protein n=1 Tax=marine sediment metagenome TaxID=412755 RepID=X1GH64_9ZZZZ
MTPPRLALMEKGNRMLSLWCRAAELQMNEPIPSEAYERGVEMGERLGGLLPVLFTCAVWLLLAAVCGLVIVLLIRFLWRRGGKQG